MHNLVLFIIIKVHSKEENVYLDTLGIYNSSKEAKKFSLIDFFKDNPNIIYNNLQFGEDQTGDRFICHTQTQIIDNAKSLVLKLASEEKRQDMLDFLLYADEIEDFPYDYINWKLDINQILSIFRKKFTDKIEYIIVEKKVNNNYI